MRIYTVDDLGPESKTMLNRFFLGLERKRAGVVAFVHVVTIVSLDVEIATPASIISKLEWTGINDVAFESCSVLFHTLSGYQFKAICYNVLQECKSVWWLNFAVLHLA